MKKISTLLYSYYSLGSNENELINLDTVFEDDFGEYSEVFNTLNRINLEPDSRVVNKILEFAKSIKN